jgi:AcrR family transcriptional regulator
VEAKSERTPRGQGNLLRERLVESALAMVDEGQAAAISIRAVTKRAGVSPTAFYLHFANREQLIWACIERSFAVFRDALRSAAAKRELPRDRLLESGLAYIEFARTYPERYALIFGAREPLAVDETDEPEENLVVGGDAFRDLIELVSDNLAAAGDPVPPEEAELRARGIWAGLHGFVLLRYSRPTIGWPEDREFATRLAAAWLS